MDGLRKVRKDSEEWRELGGVFRALTILKVGARLACLCRELRGISMAPAGGVCFRISGGLGGGRLRGGSGRRGLAR